VYNFVEKPGTDRAKALDNCQKLLFHHDIDVRIRIILIDYHIIPPAPLPAAQQAPFPLAEVASYP